MKYLTLMIALLFSVSLYAADTDEPTLDDFGPQPKITNSALDIVSIETTSFMADGGASLASIQGDVIGLEYAPAGDYRVRIVNGNGFKAPRFSLMICTLKSYIEDMDGLMTGDIAILSTAFTDLNGKVFNSLGYYSGATAYPSDGYKVIVLNGGGVQFWNSMNCRIK